MSNVIDFPRITKSSDDGEWIFNLSIYSHGAETSAFITDVSHQIECMSKGDAHRLFASRLDDLSFLMRQIAEKEDVSERGEALCVVTIFSGGLVQSRVNTEKIVTDEQRSWVREQLNFAKQDKNLLEF